MKTILLYNIKIQINIRRKSTVSYLHWKNLFKIMHYPRLFIVNGSVQLCSVTANGQIHRLRRTLYLMRVTSVPKANKLFGEIAKPESLNE